MPNLTQIDWLILLLYLASVLGVGLLIKLSTRNSSDFFQAGRSLPAWICGLAMVSISIGAPELIGMGAWGAQYGLEAAQFFGIGAIPAMLFAGLFIMPVYYRSNARTVPEFVRLRFDAKTGGLSALLFLLMMTFGAGVSLYALYRAVEALQLFDHAFIQLGWSQQAIFPVVVVFAAVFVAIYVALGGLTSAIYNQVLQFCMLVAGLLPLVFLGLKNTGGWEGLKAKLPVASTHAWSGMLHPHNNPMGIELVALALGLGFVLSFGFWGTDFALVQTAMAANSVESARRTPIIAAFPRLLLPFLLIVPGMIAISLPTPHTTTTVNMGPDGSIVHNIQVVSPAAEHGKGLVPARTDATGRPLMNASGQPILDADQATPKLIAHFLPTGALGLALAALLAAFMSGFAGQIAAFSTVFTCDVYQGWLRKDAGDDHLILVGRIAVGAAALLAIAAAYAALHFANMLVELELIFSIVNAPMLAILLLGIFGRRTTGLGAFVGLGGGALAAILHYGLTASVDVPAGLHGGWLGTVHSYSSAIEQHLWGGILAFAVALVSAFVVSILSGPDPRTQPAELIASGSARFSSSDGPWWRRAETWALVLLLGMIILNIFFA